MFSELFAPEQLTILTQIILIDLVLAGDFALAFLAFGAEQGSLLGQ